MLAHDKDGNVISGDARILEQASENGCDINGNIYGDYMVKLSGKGYVEMFRHKMLTGENASADVLFGINQKKPTLIASTRICTTLAPPSLASIDVP